MHSTSWNEIRLNQTDSNIQSQKTLRSEPFLKKASSCFSQHISMDIQISKISQQDLAKNPFLRARVNAYLKGLKQKALSNQQQALLKYDEDKPDIPLSGGERVTLKKQNLLRRTTNNQTAKDIRERLTNAQLATTKISKQQ